MYFLIDYENVNYAGLEGTELLETGDTVSIFFSDSQYLIVLCKVWKWDAEQFVHAMEKLHNKMLLLGYGECVNFFEELGIRE